MSDPVRVRIAPSPTGMFHVGTARTALINWAYARHHGGKFLVRIEDTDRARHDDDAVRGIFAALTWLGLDWDEDPIFQSDNASRHEHEALRLFDAGLAYWCDCTSEEVKARTDKPGYDGACAERGLSQAPGRVLRFRSPTDGATVITDIVRGTPSFPNSTLEDFALLRGDGSALFLLANVIDDADSGITHVIRGEDHLGNTAKYVQLWAALGYGPVPVFAHLPLLVKLNEDGTKPKLSKRRDRVAIEDFRDLGFLAEAMAHYLGSLGFTSADDGLFDLNAFAANLQLEQILPSPAVFDEAKLRNVNGDHIRALSSDAYLETVTAYVGHDLGGIDELARVTQTRVETLAETLDMLRFVLDDDLVIDPDSWAAVLTDTELASSVLDAAASAYALCAWDTTSLHETTNELVGSLGLKLRKAQLPIRVSITGQRIGPPLFEALSALGRERTLERLAATRARLG